jgi:hypothetical protein
MPGAFIFRQGGYNGGMKQLVLCSGAALLLLAGCSDKTNQPGSASNSGSSGGNPVTAPVDYLKAAANGQQTAIGTVDTTSLDKAIQLFNVDQGRNPTDLNELVQKKYIPIIPTPPNGSKLVYDSAAGKVTVEKK